MNVNYIACAGFSVALIGLAACGSKAEDIHKWYYVGTETYTNTQHTFRFETLADCDRVRAAARDNGTVTPDTNCLPI